jgi:hypothetical protein
LETAFGVLDRMKAEGVQPDDMVYRSLLEVRGGGVRHQRTPSLLQR